MGAQANMARKAPIHTDAPEIEWRNHVKSRFEEIDARFAEIEEGQKAMRDEIAENTRVTKETAQETGRTADIRHGENVARMETIESLARNANATAEKMQTDVAGLVQLYDGAKVVRGLAISARAAVIHIAGLALAVTVIVEVILHVFKGTPLPPLFGR